MTTQNLSLKNIPGSKYFWGNLPGAALSLALSQAAVQANAPLVVITPDILTSQRLEDEIRFFLQDESIELLQFPDRETLPYDIFSPHRDIISERLLTLFKLPTLKRGILFVATSTLMHYLPPRNFLEGASFILNKGEQLDGEQLKLRLTRSGYRHVNQVMEHGEFALRGSIIDLYPMGSSLPYRIDLFDEEVDSIRTFDPDSQRSLETLDFIRMLPAHEFPLTEEAITLFRQNWRNEFQGNPVQCPVYQDVSSAISSPGIEYYLPLFFNSTNTLFDYLTANSIMVKVGDIEKSANNFWEEINARYTQRSYDITRPLTQPKKLFLATNELFHLFNQFAQVQLDEEKIAEKIIGLTQNDEMRDKNSRGSAVYREVHEHSERVFNKADRILGKSSNKINFNCASLPDLIIDRKKQNPLEKFSVFRESTTNRILIAAETAGRREALQDLFKKIAALPLTEFTSWQEFLNSNIPLGITIAPITTGAAFHDLRITLIAEAQLFGQHIIQQRRRQKEQVFATEGAIRDLVELEIGAPIVHIDHGVGRYLGLQQLTVGEFEAEYLMIEYAHDAKLYVPVSSLHLISRYTGPNVDNAPLNRLGTEQWTKAKQKAAEKIHDVAAELLELYAAREVKSGFQFSPVIDDYRSFSEAFPFEPTFDQEKAFTDIINDMTAAKKMDRLICGDVGFGKTEVAMRAAFIAAQNSKQVAILVPTTLLAQQHYQSFSDRFVDWPIRIGVLSRFQNNKQQTEIINQLADGAIDIIIGTHKLIQKDIRFKNLGLLIIDEEHRFGVKQKERLKALRSDVDILTLTATPIPRTLNMALAGVRDLSIISTPPQRRLAIKTFVQQKNDTLIREAVLREILRGGQVYYLHNTVATIENAATQLQEIVPEIKAAVAHGQMHEKELEQVMSNFYHHRFNVLICTTIIESGIDIPTANTIIIERADKFGLAELHQLRGRVGRSHHQAYAYLMVPGKEVMTQDSHKRLEAIASLEELGAGFMLATHDLEIRGAGEILGEEQSGQMELIGYTLYMELLERAVNSLKSGHILNLENTFKDITEIELKIPALIPETFIADVHTRLMFYKRIANAKNQERLNELQVELIDRFGLFPEPLKNLFSVTELKLQAEALGIKKIEAGQQEGIILFKENPHIDPNRIITLVQLKPKNYKLAGSDRLKIYFPNNQNHNLPQTLHDMLVELAGKTVE